MKCERCKKENGPLTTIGCRENHSEYILVCDDCVGRLELWLRTETTWREAVNSREEPIWSRELPIASEDEIDRVLSRHVRCLNVLRTIRSEHPSYWLIDKMIDDVMIENGLIT